MDSISLLFAVGQFVLLALTPAFGQAFRQIETEFPFHATSDGGVLIPCRVLIRKIRQKSSVDVPEKFRDSKDECHRNYQENAVWQWRL